MNIVVLKHAACVLACWVGSAACAADYAAGDRWWPVGEGREMPKEMRYANEAGAVTTLNANGPVATQGHAFFTRMALTLAFQPLTRRVSD